MLEKRYQVKSFLFASVAGLLGALLVVKLVFRPWVIQHSNWRVAEIVVFSFPSYVESFLVATLLFVAMTLLKRSSLSIFKGFTEHFVFWFSIVLTGIHVISQEMQEYNLGGVNVVDPWDMFASFLGLATIGLLFFRFQFWEVSNR